MPLYSSDVTCFLGETQASDLLIEGSINREENNSRFQSANCKQLELGKEICNEISNFVPKENRTADA